MKKIFYLLLLTLSFSCKVNSQCPSCPLTEAKIDTIWSQGYLPNPKNCLYTMDTLWKSAHHVTTPNLTQVLTVGNNGGGIDILNVPNISDASNNIQLSPSGRNLVKSSGATTLDWENRALVNGEWDYALQYLFPLTDLSIPYWKQIDSAMTKRVGWKLTGNAGTVAGTNFMGTTDNVDIVFKRNNVEVGRFTSGKLSITTNAASAFFSATDGTVSIQHDLSNAGAAIGYNIGTTSNHGLGFFTNGGTNKMWLGTNGWLSILNGSGNYNAITPLQVNGAIFSNGGGSDTPLSGANILQMDYLGSGAYAGWRTNTAHTTILETDHSSNVLSIPRDNNRVGINNPNPLFSLDGIGSFHFSGTQSGFYSNGVTESRLGDVDNNGDNVNVVVDNTLDEISLINATGGIDCSTSGLATFTLVKMSTTTYATNAAAIAAGVPVGGLWTQTGTYQVFQAH